MDFLTPRNLEIVNGVLIVLFALYVLFCLGVFRRDR